MDADQYGKNVRHIRRLIAADELTQVNYALTLDAAISGLGVMCQPRFTCHEAITAGLLEPVFSGYQWADLEAYAVYPSTRSLPLRLRTFIDFLAARWGDCPYWENC